MANGFAPYLLKHISAIAVESTPQYKMEVPGFLNLLMSQSKPADVKLNTPTPGSKSTVLLK